MEDYLQRKTMMEDNLGREMTENERQPLIEDDFDGGQPLMQSDLL